MLQYKNLLSSFNQFMGTQEQKFQKVQNLHMDEFGQMISQALSMDRIICQRLLGWHWEGPNEDNLEPLPLRRQQDLIDLKGTTKQIKLKRIEEGEKMTTGESHDSSCEDQACCSILCEGGDVQETVKRIGNNMKKLAKTWRHRYCCGINDKAIMDDNAHITAMIALLSQEASFLSNGYCYEEVNNSILSDAMEEHLPGMSRDTMNVLRALGISTENGLKVTA